MSLPLHPEPDISHVWWSIDHSVAFSAGVGAVAGDAGCAGAGCPSDDDAVRSEAVSVRAGLWGALEGGHVESFARVFDSR